MNSIYQQMAQVINKLFQSLLKAGTKKAIAKDSTWCVYEYPQVSNKASCWK